jgi:hypothetical protein
LLSSHSLEKFLVQWYLGFQDAATGSHLPSNTCLLANIYKSVDDDFWLLLLLGFLT